MRPDFLQALYEMPGPFATAYLDPVPPDADSIESVPLRWRALSGQMLNSGADSATVEAMEETMVRPRAGRQSAAGVVAVATEGKLVYSDVLGESVGGDRSGWNPLPDLGPYVRIKARGRRQVVAIVDRAGADLLVRDSVRIGEAGNGGGRGVAGGQDVLPGREVQDRHYQAEGRTHPLHKVRGGGWAHRRLQNTVEEVVERNAAMVADELASLVQRAGPSVIVLAGEVDARSRVYRHLPSAVQRAVTVTEKGGRAPGSKSDPDRLVEDALADAEAHEAAELVDRLESGIAARTSVRGVRDVLTAFRQGAVDRLLYLVDEDQPSSGLSAELDQRVLIGSDPVPRLAEDAEPDSGRYMGAAGPDQAGDRTHDRLDSALLRAVVSTGASVEVVRSGQPGLAALLRFALID